MEGALSPDQLKRRPQQKLAQWLRPPGGGASPSEVAVQLKQLAKEVLGPAPEQALMLQRTLAKLVALYRGLDGTIARCWTASWRIGWPARPVPSSPPLGGSA